MLALLGGLVAVDGTSFAQIMISRPLVAGAVTGLVFGRPLEGVAVGVILEVFSLAILPIGAARYPESGTAAVAAAGAYAMVAGPPGPDAHLLALAVLYGLALERVMGSSVVLQRRFNERFATGDGEKAKSARALEREHMTAMGMDLLRGASLTVVGGLVGAGLLRALDDLNGFAAGTTWGVLGVATAAMLATVLPVFGGWAERRFPFLLGLGCGVLLVLIG